MASNVDVMYRLVWNTNGWRAPTGGFLEADYTWAMRQGFGHEEWHFQTKDAVDGYIYSYVYARPARVLDKKEKFRAVFYSIAPDSRWLLVGEYAEAEVIDKNDGARVDQSFEKNGVYDERTEQLISLTSDREDFLGHDFTKLSLSERRSIIRKNLKDSVLNNEYILKCPVGKVVPYPGGIPIESGLLGELRERGTQYIRPFYPSESIQVSLPTRTKAMKKTLRLNEGAYWRLSPEKQRRIWKKHNEMSNRFADWLVEEGYQDVKQENFRVDVEFKSGERQCRAELKICGEGKPLWSIREAIGQLLEYNLYGNREFAEFWVIVLDEKPHPWDFDFIDALRSSYNLPIWLGWQEGDNFSLEKKP